MPVPEKSVIVDKEQQATDLLRNIVWLQHLDAQRVLEFCEGKEGIAISLIVEHRRIVCESRSVEICNYSQRGWDDGATRIFAVVDPCQN